MECNFRKSFRFEQMWMSDKGCSEIVEVVWKERITKSCATKVIQKVAKCAAEHTRWSEIFFGSVHWDLEMKRKQLKQAEKIVIQGADIDRMRQLKQEINLLLDKEAKMSSQRSRVMWLKDGDRNTKFFHSKATQRRSKNYIRKLHDASGRWCTQRAQVVDTIVNFYQDLFATTNSASFEEVTDTIPQLVTAKMNDILLSEFKS